MFADHRVAYAGGRVSLFDSADFPYTIQERAERLDIAPRSYLPAGLIMGANMAFRRSTLRASGGFDPLLGPGGPCRSGADTDALVRSSAAGFAGVYDPGPVVLHHHGRKAGDIPALKARYAFGRGATHVKAIAGSPLRMLYLAAWLKALCLPGERGWLERLVELRGAARYLALHRQARRERHAATGPARRPRIRRGRRAHRIGYFLNRQGNRVKASGFLPAPPPTCHVPLPPEALG